VTSVLLFGASGFLGTHVRAALAPQCKLVCPSRDECDLWRVDVETLTALVRAVNPDAVVNCAGKVAGTRHELMCAHVAATSKLVDAISVGAPQARLVRLGSAAEYGQVRDGHAVREGDPQEPVSDYGESHLAGTRATELASAAGRVDAVVLRVFNAVGPGLQADTVLGRAAILLRQAIFRGDGQVAMGVLDTYRDFVDARDVALAVRAALVVTSLPERVFNVGSGRTVPTRYAVELLAEAAGFSGEFRDGGLSATAGRSAAVPWMRADVSRAGRVLGWAPTYDLADSVKALWAGAR
jgi:NDP-hexose 4-ketoreductase